MRPRTDPVTLTVVDNYLTSTCREMGTMMMTTSYSPIFSESRDFSCVIFNPAGEMLAQAEFCPSQIGTIRFTVAWTIAELGLDGFSEGDVVIHNDPYRGSGHVPEHMVLKPVYWKGDLRAFVANVAHMSEIGAKTPGGLCGDATEIFQEGLLLPPIKIKREGEDVDDVWKIILSNHRTPRVSNGDLRAMIGSLDFAEARVHKFFADYGVDVFEAATQELLAASEERMRADIMEIPDGTYFAEEILEDDGVGGTDFVIRCALRIDGGDAVVDFTGSSPQSRGPINDIYAVTASAVYNAFLHVTDPLTPRNEGCYRPFTIIAPPASIMNCSFPAPVGGGNTETSPRVTETIFRALADVIPDRIIAACGGTSSPFLFGGQNQRTGEPYAHFHFEGCGWGARHDADGNDMLITINGNCPTTPVEVFESRYPFRVESYRLRTDSGGAGMFRGGLGIERVLTVLDDVTVSGLFNRMIRPPWGIAGGKEAATGGIWVRLREETAWKTMVEAFGTASSMKFAGIELHVGDQVKIATPGGGGYGDPQQRDSESVRRDVLERYVSREAANTAYGPWEER